MASDRVKRAFIWMRTAMRIIDKTTLPGEIAGEIRPTIDTFGWDRLNPESSGPGEGPQSININGALANTTAAMAAVPDGVMRYIINASCQTDDPALVAFLRMEVVKGGIAIAAQEPFFINANGANVRIGMNRHLLLETGDVLQCVSSVAPAAGQRNAIRARFVDIDFGEYIPAV